MQITINDVNNLTNMERDILRVVLQASVVEGLKDAVRGMAWQDECYKGLIDPGVDEMPQPIEPTETFSPHVQVLPEPPSAPTLTRDSRGLPWDRRIHASTKAINADGTWRNMRGVDKDLLASVEQELRAVQALPVPVQDPMDGHDEGATPPAPPVPVAAPSFTVEEVAAAFAVPPTPPVPPSATPQTFVQLMQYVTPKLVAGTLTQARLQEVVGALGLPHLAALGTRPDLIPAVYAEVSK